MTRIIGGNGGGRRHHHPRGQHTRPTSDRVREALFSASRPGAARCGPALPRPVRRFRGGRPRGLVPRRRRGHPGRAGPAYRRPDRRATPRRSASRKADVVAGPSPATLARPPGAVRRGVPRPALPRSGRPTVGRPRAGRRTAGWSRARWSWSSGRRAARSRRGPTAIDRAAAEAVRRDHALVRSRRFRDPLPAQE